MKRKIIMAACAVLAITLSAGAYLFIADPVKNANKTGSISANFREKRFAEHELIKMADLIALCKVDAITAREKKSGTTTGSGGEEFKVTLPTVTYRLKIAEVLKGAQAEELDLVMLDRIENTIETGEEYVVFLNGPHIDNTYNLLSYSQGLNKVKNRGTAPKTSEDHSEDEEIEFVAGASEITSYAWLKKRIKELSME